MSRHGQEVEVDINYEMIYEIVKKPPKDRTPENIKYLMHLPVDILREQINPYAALYARYLEFEQHKQNKQIFASKQRKNGIYWVIEGEFGVYNKKNIIIRAYKNLDYLSQNDVMSDFEDFQEVRALESTTVGYISDRTMIEIIEPLKKEARWKLHDFLSCTPLLANWTFNQIKFLLTFFNTLTFGKNSYVFQEKQDSSAIYFVKEGLFDIRKNFNGASDYEERVIKEGIVIKDLPVSKIQKLQMKEFKITSLNLGDYFGEEDVLSGNSRSFSVLCNSLQGEVAYISSEHFIEFIYKDGFSKAIIDQKIKKKDQTFQKREANIKDSLNNYGKFLVNEHFNKNLDQIITELAIQPQVKTYNEIEKEQVIKQMQSLTNIQSTSPRRQKGLIRNETLADIEELSDEAVAKMVNNNLFSKKRIPTEQKIDELTEQSEKQVFTVQDDDVKFTNPDQIQNRVDEILRVTKQTKQNYLYDWRGKKQKEFNHVRSPSDNQRELFDEYGSNPPSQPPERISNQTNNEYFLDDERSNSPNRYGQNTSISPLQRYNTKLYLTQGQNQYSFPNSPKAISMTDLFKQQIGEYPNEDGFKIDKIPLPLIQERNSSQQNTGRLINMIPSVQQHLQKQNTGNYQPVEKQRTNFKSQNSIEQFMASNQTVSTLQNQLQTEPSSEQYNKQRSGSSNSEFQHEQTLLIKNQSNSQSPPLSYEKNGKASERDSTKMKKIMEQVDDKFQSYHANLSNQCQNFFTTPVQNSNSYQKKTRTNSSKSPDLGSTAIPVQDNAQPDLMQLISYQNSSGSQNQQQQLKTNQKIQSFEQKDIQIGMQPNLKKGNQDSSSPQYKFIDSPQTFENRISNESNNTRYSIKDNTNSKQQGLSHSPRLKTGGSLTTNFHNHPQSANNASNKNLSFVEKIRNNVKGPSQVAQNIYYNSSNNDTPIQSPQPKMFNGRISMTTNNFSSNDNKNPQSYYKKSTLTDLYLSQFDGQQSKEGKDIELDNQKSNNSTLNDDYNTKNFNFNNNSVEELTNQGQQVKVNNQNQPLSLERKDNSSYLNSYDLQHLQSKTSPNQDVISRKLLFYKANTNYSQYKTSMPISNRPIQSSNQNLSQKLLSERYQKFKLQHNQMKKVTPASTTFQNQISQNYIDDPSSKVSMTNISSISQFHTVGNNMSSLYTGNLIDKINQNDSTNDNFFSNTSKIQKVITNKPQQKYDSYNNNSMLMQKRAKSHNVLPAAVSYNEFNRQQQTRDHLASPQDHLQKILNKKEKSFRKNLFASQGNQTQALQSPNQDANNPYFNTYIQLDYMNAYKISQAKNKNYSGGNISTPQTIMQYIPISPEKKKGFEQSTKYQNKIGSRNNHRQLVS